MFVIGLTGGIGTGKSTVAKLFQQRGAAVIDADQLAREVVRPGRPALDEIVERFGKDVLTRDGQLDRARLAEVVFNDPDARKDLEQIVHPRVREMLLDQLERLKQQGSTPVVIYDVPLLFEAGSSLPMVDKIVVVYAPRDVQKKRLVENRGFDPGEAERRINAQMPTEGKAARADYVIDNSGDLAATEQQVDQLWKEWTG